HADDADRGVESIEARRPGNPRRLGVRRLVRLNPHEELRRLFRRGEQRRLAECAREIPEEADRIAGYLGVDAERVSRPPVDPMEDRSAVWRSRIGHPYVCAKPRKSLN